MEPLKKTEHAAPVSHESPPQQNEPPRAPSRTTSLGSGRKRLSARMVMIVLLLSIAVVGPLTFGVWGPALRSTLASVQDKIAQSKLVHEEHGVEQSEAHHDHAGGAADANSNSLVLSENGRKNIGLALLTVQPQDYVRTISVPAMLAERPGRTEVMVAAPMTGVVTRIYPIRGEAVQPGQPLVSLRLTHEDLVEKQSNLLRELEELDVVKREVARLREVTANGAVAGKRLLEQEYEQSKIEAAVRADTQALILHGLTQEQVDQIATDRRLVQEITVAAPRAAGCDRTGQHQEFLQVAALSVEPGEQVVAGRAMLTLTDHCELYIEGRAFEQDAAVLSEAANGGTAVTAAIDPGGSGGREVKNLRVEFVENAVEENSRALKFYVRIGNELVRNEVTPDGHRFIGWRYRPGQRVQLYVPVESWQDRIVLPVEAAIQDGSEWFVFRQNGSRFERLPVHVEYRDQRFAVVENDGTLFPGDVVAASGAYQMHLALKNKAGGGVDPHAGHNH